MSSVSLVNVNNLKTDLERVIELINGFDFNGINKITIKPNLCVNKNSQSGATTDVNIVKELINLIKKKTNIKEIFIVESGTSFNKNLFEIYNDLGYSDLQNIAHLLDLSQVKCINLKMKGRYFNEIEIPEFLLENDNFFISIAKLKTHYFEQISCTLKNQFGCLPEKKKYLFHPYLAEVICDINQLISPDLGIIEGLIAMEGNGPVNGEPKKTNILMASKDIVSLDIAAASLMGLNYKDVPHLMLAIEKKLGSEKFELIGDEVEPFKFKKPDKILKLSLRTLLTTFRLTRDFPETRIKIENQLINLLR